MKAIIMAGGDGSRLRPLTCTKPKPMMKLLGKPALEYAIEHLKKHHITEIGITLRYMPDEIMDYFGDGSDFGVSISYFVEKTPLGTAGSVKSALSFVDDTFVVISGDALSDIDLTDALDFHRQNGADATVVLKKVDIPLDYGVVVTDKNGKIVRFIEKPDWGEVASDSINTGIYVLNREIFENTPSNAPFDFSYDLFPSLLQRKKALYGYNTEGYWCDIGDTLAYMTCQHDILSGKVDITLESKQVSDGIYIGKDVTIEPGAELVGPLYIGDNVHIGRNVRLGEYSIVESGATIADFVNVKKSIVGAGAHVGAFSQLRACIIGDKTRLKPSVCVYEQSVIGDMCYIGEGSVIKPSIKLWPNKTVEAHTQVHTNLVWKKTYKKKLFDSGRISGEIGIDLTPESISLIAATFGALTGGGRIAASYSGDASASMLAGAFISGLMSSGCEVYDCGLQLGAMTRFALRFYNLDGGVHISVAHRSYGHYATITLIDSDGCDISAKKQRKLENMYEREDFVRAHAFDIRKVINVSNYKEFYIRDILRRTTTSNIDAKILISTKNKTAADIIERICGEIGAKVQISTENISSPDKTNAFAARVAEEGFMFGALIDEEGEQMILVDDTGRILKKNDMLALDVIITLDSNPKSNVIMPVSAPQSLARLAEKNGHKVIYTKIETSDFMRSIAENGSEEQFVLSFDAVGTVLRLMVYLSENSKTLSQLCAQSDEYFITSDKVYCHTERKGRIIKEIAKQFEGSKTDFTDGIKVFSDNGWVLVVPDHAASMSIISEGLSAEIADELCADMVKKIKEIERKS